ncbi:MAG: hydrogenase 4 subunit F [Chloroflexota bacterium]
MLIVLLAVPAATALLCGLLWRRPWVEWLNAAGAAATLGAALLVAGQVLATSEVEALWGLLRVDALSALFLVLVAFVGLLGALYSIEYLRHDVAAEHIPLKQAGWFYPGLHAFLWTMLATVCVANLGLLWVAVEATTLASALLVGFYRTRAALEAAWKYLILCTVGITFALFGILLTYVAVTQALGEHSASLDWHAIARTASRLDPELMKLAWVFIVIGFGAKAGIAPLHTWLPDAHSQAPSPISAVLSGVLLNCALYSILRFRPIADASIGDALTGGILLGFGLFSVAVAAPFILVQRDVKRLLAYSSVEHIGLAIAAFGLGGAATFAGLLHLVHHSITKPLLFFAAGDLVNRFQSHRIARIRGALRAAPFSGTLFCLGVFAIVGLPPSGIFVSELGILWAGISQGRVWPTLVLIALLTIVFVGMIWHLVTSAFGEPGPAPGEGARRWTTRTAMVVPAMLVVILGVYTPGPLQLLLDRSVAILSGASR